MFSLPQIRPGLIINRIASRANQISIVWSSRPPEKQLHRQYSPLSALQTLAGMVESAFLEWFFRCQKVDILKSRQALSCLKTGRKTKPEARTSTLGLTVLKSSVSNRWAFLTMKKQLQDKRSDSPSADSPWMFIPLAARKFKQASMFSI